LDREAGQYLRQGFSSSQWLNIIELEGLHFPALSGCLELYDILVILLAWRTFKNIPSAVVAKERI
jgi:hypothetical protein